MVVACPFRVVDQVMIEFQDTEPRVLGQEFDLACTLRVSVRMRDAESFARRVGDIEGVNVSFS